MKMKLSVFLQMVGAKVSALVVWSSKKAKAAVENEGYALRYVKEQTPEICKAAVENDGDALIYVKEQTPEICKAAVERNGYALSYVDFNIFDLDIKLEVEE